MKQMLCLLFASVLLLCAFGCTCNNKTPQAQATDLPTVSPTESAQADTPSPEASASPEASPESSETAQALESILDGAAGLEISMAPIVTVDMANADSVSYYLGLSDATGVTEAVVAEPLMSSIAFSAVLLKVEDSADKETLKKNIAEGVNLGKWVCVCADKIVANDSGEYLFFVMSQDDLVDAVMDSFATLYGSELGEPVERTFG